MGGGMMDMSSDFMNDKLINFSVTTPVSGTTLEDRPLLNALLSNDEYRQQYYDYLNEIAENFFSEENMTTMTSKIVELITPYVKKDPTKFYTMEKFTEAISGETTLVDFAKKRAESILAQLSGDLVIAAETTTDIQDVPPDVTGEQPLPENGQGQGPPDLGNGNFQPPNIREGEGMQPPGMNRQSTDNPQNVSTYSMSSIIINSFFVLLLIAATLFAVKFKRR